MMTEDLTDEEAKEADETLDQLMAMPEIAITVSPIVLFAIVTNLQLALRHPANQGNAGGDLLQRLIADMRSIFPAGSPADLSLAKGWDEEFDCHRSGLCVTANQEDLTPAADDLIGEIADLCWALTDSPAT